MSHLRELFVAFSNKEPPPGNMRAPGVNWYGGCGACCNQFQLYIGGWATKPRAYGPNAEIIGDNSGWLNPNAATAPIGAWHFWHLGTEGHVAPDLDGGGRALGMATSRKLGIDLGNGLRIVSVAQYTASGATYRGWSTNYYGGTSNYVEPAMNGNERLTVAAGANVRAEPSTASPALTPLKGNIVYPMNGFIHAQAVNGNDVWFRHAFGYSHSSGFVDQGTHDLPDLTPPPVVYVTAKFDSNGSVIKTEKVVSGTAPTPPADPEATGFIFKGWDPAIKPITVDTIYAAVWERVPTSGLSPADIDKIAAAVDAKLKPRFDAILTAIARIPAAPTVFNITGTATVDKD